MKRPYLYLLLFLSSLPAVAEGVDTRYQLFAEAIEVAAKVDAYNNFCELESDFRFDFVLRAEKDQIVKLEDEGGQALQNDVYEGVMKALEERQPPCKDVEFLLEKLDLMRALKAVTVVINGKESQDSVGTQTADPL